MMVESKEEDAGEGVVGGQARGVLYSRTPLPKRDDTEMDKLSQYDNASVQLSKQKIDAWLDKFEPSKEGDNLKDFVEPTHDILQLESQLQTGHDRRETF